MTRMLLAVAAAALAVGSARADWGGATAPVPGSSPQMPPPGSYSGPNTLFGAGAAPGRPPAMYGLNPALQRGFRTGPYAHGYGSGYGCGQGPNCGQGYAGPAGPGYGYPQQPPTMQGTLAFPQHPFVRSPRDFFMYEPGR